MRESHRICRSNIPVVALLHICAMNYSPSGAKFKFAEHWTVCSAPSEAWVLKVMPSGPCIKSGDLITSATTVWWPKHKGHILESSGIVQVSVKNLKCYNLAINHSWFIQFLIHFEWICWLISFHTALISDRQSCNTGHEGLYCPSFILRLWIPWSLILPRR